MKKLVIPQLVRQDLAIFSFFFGPEREQDWLPGHFQTKVSSFVPAELTIRETERNVGRCFVLVAAASSGAALADRTALLVIENKAKKRNVQLSTNQKLAKQYDETKERRKVSHYTDQHETNTQHVW